MGLGKPRPASRPPSTLRVTRSARPFHRARRSARVGSAGPLAYACPEGQAHDRNRVEKPAAYAATGIGVYLLVDRDTNTVVVHSRPAHGQYLERSTHFHGEAVPIPGLGVALDTESLKRFAR